MLVYLGVTMYSLGLNSVVFTQATFEV